MARLLLVNGAIFEPRLASIPLDLQRTMHANGPAADSMRQRLIKSHVQSGMIVGQDKLILDEGCNNRGVCLSSCTRLLQETRRPQ